MSLTISELGEFGFLKRLDKLLSRPLPGTILGMGDDAALVRPKPGMDLAVTCDAMVEGVHFKTEYIRGVQLGLKAAGANFSDMAAMGAMPGLVFVSLALPFHTPVAFIEDFYSGLEQACQLLDARIVGGNLASSPQGMMVDITVLGWVEQGQALTRKTAKPGDTVVVSGTLGDSAAGLHLLQHHDSAVPDPIRETLILAHLAPSHRVELGRILSRSRQVRCAMDVSDGLVQDLGHLCAASGLGADLWVDRVPVSEALCDTARITGQDPLHYALFGGEDYELLFTVAPDLWQAIHDQVQEQLSVPLTVIGQITNSHAGVSAFTSQGNRYALKPSQGWDHFTPHKKGMPHE